MADRWHLWHNLGEAVERAVSRHREHLPAALGAQAVEPAAATEPDPAPPPAAPRTGRVPERTRERHAAVHQMLGDGRSHREIVDGLGLSRNTVRRFVRAASPEELLVNDGTGRQPSMLAEHAPYLRERWNCGCSNATPLWQEIRARGYPGGYGQVRDYLARFRAAGQIPAPAPVPPKATSTASLLKRQMYGRAGPDLLRRRVLLAD